MWSLHTVFQSFTIRGRNFTGFERSRSRGNFINSREKSSKKRLKIYRREKIEAWTALFHPESWAFLPVGWCMQAWPTCPAVGALLFRPGVDTVQVSKKHRIAIAFRFSLRERESWKLQRSYTTRLISALRHAVLNNEPVHVCPGIWAPRGVEQRTRSCLSWYLGGVPQTGKHSSVLVLVVFLTFFGTVH
jgi:hypothetical protein